MTRRELIEAALTNDPAEVQKIKDVAFAGHHHALHPHTAISGNYAKPIEQMEAIVGPRISFNPNPVTVPEKGDVMSMLNALKNLNLERTDPDEMVALITFGTQMKATYAGLESEVPEWLETNLESVKREFDARRQDSIAKEIKDTQSRLEALKTSEQKRADLNAKLRRLKAQVK